MNAVARISEPRDPREFAGMSEPDLFDGLTWFAVVARPGRAQEAAFRLREQGYGAYLPMCRVERCNRGQGRKEAVLRPLFGRYLFVGVERRQPFSPVSNTRGVSFVVRDAAGFPCRVTPLALRLVKSRCDEDGGAMDLIGAAKASPAAEWAPDQALRVVAGPFREFVALFERYDGGDVAHVLVQLFGRVTPAAVRVRDLEPCGSR